MPLNVLVPEISDYHLTPADRRYSRNCDRFKTFIQRILMERKSGKSKTYGDNDDLLSILTSADVFKNDNDAIEHEIFGFFMAGMKTIQISTTNLIYYLNKHPECK